MPIGAAAASFRHIVQNAIALARLLKIDDAEVLRVVTP